jgi:excisionase family DNA binding protein
MPRVAEQKWLSLGDAKTILGVNETTLRGWADVGRVRSFRTPGGHRRFSKEDIERLVAKGQRETAGNAPGISQETAVERIRRRLHRNKGPAYDWTAHFDEETKNRMRVLGRLLVNLATDYASQKRKKGELTEEARYIGMEYGRLLSSAKVSLKDALAAFVYFRNSLHEAMTKQPAAGGAHQDVGEMLSGIASLEDAVLLAISEAYESKA